MTSFWQIFSLEFKGLWRTKTLAILLIAALVWMLTADKVVSGDGTIEGAKEMYLKFSLGGVFAITLIASVFAATASIAKERAEKRLQLTMVRPVRYSIIAIAKTAAITFAGFMVLAFATAIAVLRVDTSDICYHVVSPILESPRAEAERMYRSYMEDPNTPEYIKRAKKSLVVRILTQRALDHFETIDSGETGKWKFSIPSSYGAKDIAAQIRFTNLYDMRSSVFGVFTLGDRSGSVSNITQSILSVKLSGSDEPFSGEHELKFENRGSAAVMLRNRKDVHLLIPADARFYNLIRSLIQLTSILSFVVALSMFLGASLSRPVATFVAILMLLITEMSPSVIEQYPDELETKLVDRVGLYMTRLAEKVTRPLSSLNPLEALSRGECVEFSDTLEASAVNFILVPSIFALLSALALAAKKEP